MILNIMILAICCFAINYFSDKLGDILSNLGIKLKIPSSIRGATFDGISSSLPELLTVLVGVMAVVDGSNPEAFNDIGVGTIGGSAMFNLLLIPMFSIFFYKGDINLSVNKKDIVRDMLFYIISIGTLFMFSMLGYFNFITGIVLLSVYVGYVFKLIYDARNYIPEDDEFELDNNISILKMLTMSLIYLIPIGLSVHYAVGASIEISDILQIPQMVISLIILAAVTSIPDMFLSINSAKRGELDASISNAVGSNIFDICFCLGIGLVLTGTRIKVDFAEVLPIFTFLAISSVVTSIFFLSKITRFRSLILLATYVSFIGYIIYSL